MSASQLIWQMLARHPREDCEDTGGGACWLCGSPWHRGRRVEAWSGALFTGQSRVRAPTATHVCEPCVEIASRISPVPGRPPKPGKKYGGNWRNYSHLYDAGDYMNASKGEKPLVLAFLRRPKTGPWFAAIADSGQKHVVPWVPVNPGGGVDGRVLFDETPVTIRQGEIVLVDDMADLLTAGATKDETTTGDYRPQTWIRCRGDLERFEARWAAQRGSAWFGLALWLAQRDEAAVKERLRAEKEAKRKHGKTRRRAARGAANQDGGGDPGAARDVPRGVRRKRRAQALGAPADALAERGAQGGKPGRVVDADAQGPAASEPQQGMLPGFG